MISQDNQLFGVILAGGSGTRFWPLSRSQYPKQVLHLLGSDSMLQATMGRLLPMIPLDQMAIVTNASQEPAIRLELYRKGWEGVQLWLEPQGKNTAAAVGLAAIRLQDQPDRIMAVFPADHHIEDQAGLLAALDQGAKLAQAGYLVTFGILPTRPETGYGYIKAAEPVDIDQRAFKCARFIEKPDLARAQSFVTEGDYYWNSGMFMFRVDTILQALARYVPELYGGLRLLAENNQPTVLAEVYQTFPHLSLDHGVLEQAENVAVVPVDLGWSDVGTWRAVQELFPADARGNVILGRALDRDSRDCLIYTQERLVATLGLDQVMVVDTPDATLVCHRDRVQEVKDLVDELNHQNCAETQEHRTVKRPWGQYTVMDEGLGYKVKQIVVDPGKRLSLQLHHHRAEHWVVVQGIAQVTIGQEYKPVAANESVFVPPKTPHRLENLTAEPL
ncbi:MAG: mannose-1-phosphate guanylyltransferase/mannose-6-phosphate isomerase, partial [Deltaproteobacteria bacterium]|nr:mannose-1-phosphate guanylyltransferase/mannose-6-phosphate isomerase [Deltaproteobacteria bacterium]